MGIGDYFVIFKVGRGGVMIVTALILIYRDLYLSRGFFKIRLCALKNYLKLTCRVEKGILFKAYSWTMHRR